LSIPIIESENIDIDDEAEDIGPNAKKFISDFLNTSSITVTTARTTRNLSVRHSTTGLE